MANSKLVLDRQAVAQTFSFGTTSASGEGLVTINKGTAAASTLVLDVKGSQNIAGDLVVVGNFSFGGTIDQTSVTNLLVKDINITLNDGGTTAGAAGAGLFVEGDSNSTIGKLLYDGSLTSKWKIGDGSTQVEVVTISASQTLTNKSISGGQITSAVANATLASTVTTNANLTGPITSVGNATSVAAQTGTGSTFVMNTSPTLVTPVLGVATGTSLVLSATASLTLGTTSSLAGQVVFRNATNAFTQTFTGSNPGASIEYLLPTTAPNASEVLTASAPSGGVVTLSWSSPAGAGDMVLASVQTVTGAKTFGTIGGAVGKFILAGSTSGSSILNAAAVAGSTTFVLPVTSGTLIGTGDTGTVTNAMLANTAVANLSGTNTGDQTTVTGNSGSTTLTAITDDTSTNATMYPTWVTAATGNLAQKVTSTKLSFNPNTGVLSSTSFTGAGTGLTGTGASFTAGNVTTNANLTGDVTSSGNATTLASYMKSCTVTGTQDSANKTFTIGTAVKSGSEQVFVNGQLLMPGSSNDYVISSTTVTFQAAFTAPASTDVIRIYGVFI